MARPAALLNMGSRNWKCSLAVIKRDIRPPLFFMAYRAIFIRVVFVSNKILMNIRMTIPAVDPYFSEAPLILLSVAFITWNCKMRPLKCKSTLIMLFHGIGKKFKSIYIVALGTIRCDTVFYKLLFMIICVTTNAFIKFQRICKFSFMTGLTIHNQMLSLQLVICFIMIKIICPLYYLK